MRRSLTPKERRAMLARQDRICANCGKLIDLQNSIAEHTKPVKLGNFKKPDCLICKTCAYVKTYGKPSTTYNSDLWAIAKAKRLARKREGTWRQPKARIASRGFPERPEGHSWQWPKRKVGQ